ncbi:MULTISPECIES: DUF1482 family protein [unclassified Erwinia]|uniref:DUF1482 family protein n=1 Tax=unclassified Erwinia TaxID=2622719 RepID=UPI000C19C4AC
MQQLLFALVVTVCPAHETCKDVIYEIYDSKQECENVIYERRIFNGNCYEVESIIHQK